MSGRETVTMNNRLERIKKYGFCHDDKHCCSAPFKPFGGAHDDGPGSLFCYGGIGTGNFGRDFTGHFARWHLECGTHRQMPLNGPRFSLRIKNAEQVQHFQLGGEGFEKPLPQNTRSVNVLFPIIVEHVKNPVLPVEFTVTSFSPVIPHDYQASSLPMVFFDVEIANASASEVEFDMALFWPNILNWHPAQNRSGTCSSMLQYPSSMENNETMPPVIWPDRTNFGNRTRLVVPEGFAAGILYTSDCPVNRSMTGSVFAGLYGTKIHSSYQSCFRFIDKSAAGNPYAFPTIEEYFFQQGKLPNSNQSWQASGEEVLGGAISGGVALQPGASAQFGFVLSWDMPLVETGAGRMWRKKYTDHYNTRGDNAVLIARHALAEHDKYLQEIDKWHERELTGSCLPENIRGAKINELYFLVDGGTLWVAGEHDSRELPAPRLGSGEHFSILEGFDYGYYYLSTFDLWPYAMNVFLRLFPELNQLVMEDYIKSIPIEIKESRAFYKTLNDGCILVKDKIPHDIGQVIGDPWHKLNDYQLAIDSNLWKDHNPMFLICYYISLKQAGKLSVPRDIWKNIIAAASFVLKQDKDEDGLPEHDSFGDSTFDAVEVAGPALFSSALCVVMWKVLEEWSKIMNDTESIVRFSELADRAANNFNLYFWNGYYFRAETIGPHRDWVLSDGLFGLLLAANAKIEIDIPEVHIRKHLLKVYETNFKKFSNGAFGLVLQSPPDGWEQLNGGVQLDEVLVGAAWSSIALMQHYGMLMEASEIAGSMYNILYSESGMQFRTPAAWNRKREFRAPLNLRPMAIDYFA